MRTRRGSPCAALLVWLLSAGVPATFAADDSRTPTAAVAVAEIYGPRAKPIDVIFDTDMDSDCDDAAALAVLHALADRGEARILATISSSKNEWTGPCIEVINRWYGRAELPIGAPKGRASASKSAFTRGVAEAAARTIQTTADAPDALTVYRRVLEEAADHSVVLVTVGALTNVANLLELPAEGGRPGGLELVDRKVVMWVCMGGNFVGLPARDNLKLGNHNFEKDRDAALRAVQRWPRPLVFVGREIGSVPSGLKAGARLAGTPVENPVRRAYELYFGGTAKDRHLADPTTVLFAVRGPRDYWDLHATGRMELHSDMTFDWKEGPATNQAYLLKRMADGKPNDRAIEKICDQLMTDAPRHRGGTTQPTPAGGVHRDAKN